MSRRMSVQEVCNIKENKIVLFKHYCSSKKDGLKNIDLILLLLNTFYGYYKLN